MFQFQQVYSFHSKFTYKGLFSLTTLVMEHIFQKNMQFCTNKLFKKKTYIKHHFRLSLQVLLLLQSGKQLLTLCVNPSILSESSSTQLQGLLS